MTERRCSPLGDLAGTATITVEQAALDLGLGRTAL